MVGKTCQFGFAFINRQEMENWLKEAGFELEETLVREPNPEVEVDDEEGVFVCEKLL